MKVVHCKKERFDVYIGRGSPYGNEFIIGVHGTRSEVIAKYRKWLLDNPDEREKLEALRGKVLGCWCKPHACHGDVILEMLYPENNLENFFTS